MEGRGSLRFKGDSIIICDAYCDTVEDSAPLAAGSKVSGLIKDNKNENTGNNLLSRNAGLRGSPRVNFTAVQTRCSTLNLAVLHKANDLFGLTLRAIDVWHESTGASARVR